METDTEDVTTFLDEETRTMATSTATDTRSTFDADMLPKLGEALKAYRDAEKRFDLLTEQRKEAKEDLVTALDHLRQVELDAVTTLPLFDRGSANASSPFGSGEPSDY